MKTAIADSKNPNSILYTHAVLDQEIAKHGCAIVKIYGGVRTLDQNAAICLCYSQRSEQSGETVIEARRYCKYHYGLPILRRDPDAQKQLKRLDKLKMTYEEKLEFMDIIQVTSLLDPHDCTEYIETMIMESAKQGFILYIDSSKGRKSKTAKVEL